MEFNQSLFEFIHELADLARDVTLRYFRQPIDVEVKSDNSPVTLADKETEALLREHIARRYPEYGIIGEEQSSKSGDSRFEWIIDPIGGTRSFISGYPLYGTLICLLDNGRSIASMIDMPALNERFYATIDSNTYFRKRQLESVAKTSHCQSLSQATLYSTGYDMFSIVENRQAEALRKQVGSVRYNGDCYLYAMLAAGWIDLVLEADLKVYDFMPLKLIIEQAGGIITDWQGLPLNKQSNGQILASANITLHQQALDKLAING